ATYDDCRAHSPVDLPEIPAELTWSRLSICPTDPACQPRDRPGRANPDDSTRGAMTGTRLFTDSDATRFERAKIEHEDDLVNQRLPWLTTSQAILDLTLSENAGQFAAAGNLELGVCTVQMGLHSPHRNEQPIGDLLIRQATRCERRNFALTTREILVLVRECQRRRSGTFASFHPGMRTIRGCRCARRLPRGAVRGRARSSGFGGIEAVAKFGEGASDRIEHRTVAARQAVGVRRHRRYQRPVDILGEVSEPMSRLYGLTEPCQVMECECSDRQVLAVCRGLRPILEVSNRIRSFATSHA